MRSSAVPGGIRMSMEDVFTDQAAFRAWYEAALPRVHRYLFNRCGRDQALAEELTQDAFVEAIRSNQRGSAEGDAVGWVIGIARHRLADHYRRRARQERGFLTLALRGASTVIPAWSGVDDDLVEAIQGLPAMQRAAILLRYVDDLPVRAVAQLLGRSEKATESLLSRGRTALRNAYAGSEA